MNVQSLIKLLLSTNQAYNSKSNDNSHPNDKIFWPKLLQRLQHDWSNSQLLP